MVCWELYHETRVDHPKIDVGAIQSQGVALLRARLQVLSGLTSTDWRTGQLHQLKPRVINIRDLSSKFMTIHGDFPYIWLIVMANSG